MGGYGEGKPDIHARRETFNRRVQETFYLGKGDDLVKFLGNLASRHPKDRTIQKDIFASGEFGVKACPDLQETPDAPAQSDPSLGRLGDATEDFQKRALPSPVAADDAQNLALLNLKTHIFECPEFFDFTGSRYGPAARAVDDLAREVAHFVSDDIAQRRV